jgi:hypothetical protein
MMNPAMLFENAYVASGGNQHARRAFQAARNSARINRLFNGVLGKNVLLQNPERGQFEGKSSGKVKNGIQSVPISKIVGSISRESDFDISFRPLSAKSAERWSSIDRAYHDGVQLPAVQLFDRDGKYYVVDGHHRISVAALHGQEFIDAVIVPLP